MTRAFLTRAELADLTGYQQRKKQCAWLRAGGWPFVVGGDGHPRVLRDELVRRLSAAEGTIQSAPKKPEPQLRFPETFAVDLSGFDVSLSKSCPVPYSHSARRIQATPAWADADAIARVYAECRHLSRKIKLRHHVDHIIPILHPLVCGLHVPENLQIIPERDNLQKGNKFKPMDGP